jgi:hypothetical protein
MDKKREGGRGNYYFVYSGSDFNQLTESMQREIMIEMKQNKSKDLSTGKDKSDGRTLFKLQTLKPRNA